MHRYQVNTAILVPTIPLMKQWITEIKRSHGYAGVFYGEQKQVYPITVFTLQSAILHLEILEEFNFLIFDEVDFLGADEYRKLLEVAKRKPYVLGLTSSIKRSDGNHDVILKTIPVIYTLTFTAAREKGQISPLIVHEVTTPMTRKEADEYDEHTKNITKQLRRFSGSMKQLILAAKRNDPGAKSGLASLVKRKVLLSRIITKKQRVLEIIRKHPNEQILIFSESVKAIQELYTYLTTEGAASCGLYHSYMKHEQRDSTLRDWGKNFRVLLSCRALERGIDVPEVRVAIILAGGRSSRQMIQRVGRIVRARPGKTAECYVVAAQGTIEQDYADRIRKLLELKAHNFLWVSRFVYH